MSRGWYPRYPADYLMNTRHLTLEQHGAYTLLLDWSWENGPIPDDPKVIARILGVHTNRAKTLWGFLRGLLQQTPGGFVSKRLEQERRKSIEISEKRAEAGRRGGQANAQANASANAEAVTSTYTEVLRTSDGAPSIWDIWRGLPGADSGGLLGRLINTYGESKVADAVWATAKERPADPKAYIQGVLRTKKRGVVF